MDGRTDRPYFTGPFRLAPGVQKEEEIFQKQKHITSFYQILVTLSQNIGIFDLLKKYTLEYFNLNP